MYLQDSEVLNIMVNLVTYMVTRTLQMRKEEDTVVSNAKRSPNQEKLLELIAKNPSITLAELAEILGVSQK